MQYPFEEHLVSENIVNRFFFDYMDQEEFNWHRDKEHRLIYVIESNGTWKYQLDNSVPKPLIKNITIFIEKEMWHRVIKGTGTLCVRIHKISSSVCD